jgi:hypothetical protein
VPDIAADAPFQIFGITTFLKHLLIIIGFKKSCLTTAKLTLRLVAN